MYSVVTAGPGCYMLEVRRRETHLPFVRAHFAFPDGTEKTLFIPSLAHTSYLINTHAKSLRFCCDATDVESVSLRRAGLIARKLFMRRRSDRRYTMTITDGTEFTPLLRREGRQGRELIRALRLIGNWGFGLMSDNLQQTPGLLAPHAGADAKAARAVDETKRPPRFAVALHLFYRDLWPEFECALRALGQPFHLIITTTENDPHFEARVRISFPSAEIHVYENRGRDIGPFIQLLYEGHLDAHPFLCKLHGKRSGTEGPRALFGEVWRRTNVADLIGSTDQVEKILDRFETTRHIGMIGSPRFRLPNEFIEHRSAWGDNRDATLAFASRMGLTPENFRLDFFAGTMFWIRQEALTPLRKLDLTLADFPDENGAMDGEFQHALERALGAIPQCAGMFLDSAPS